MEREAGGHVAVDDLDVGNPATEDADQLQIACLDRVRVHGLIPVHVILIYARRGRRERAANRRDGVGNPQQQGVVTERPAELMDRVSRERRSGTRLQRYAWSARPASPSARSCS